MKFGMAILEVISKRFGEVDIFGLGGGPTTFITSGISLKNRKFATG